MTAMDRDAIQAIIPHRDPFLFVDEIVELEPGVRAHGRWTITGDEWPGANSVRQRTCLSGPISTGSLS